MNFIEAAALLRSYGFKFYLSYKDQYTKSRIEIWSRDKKVVYLHVVTDEHCFIAKPLTSRGRTLKYLREM